MKNKPINKLIIDKLISAADLKDLIEKQTGLTLINKYANNMVYWGCCPFHAEKTPSFRLDVKKQTFHCFGCNESGNVISWLMKFNSFTYLEAVHYLASTQNLILNKKEPRIITEDTTFHKFTEYVNFFYKDKLRSNSVILEYLFKRGVSEQTIKDYGIGFISGGIYSLLSKKYSDEYLLNSGVCYLRHSDKKITDVLKYRLTIPIRNEFGKIIGFSGRNINDKKDYPKYINTPETKFFKKREILYGLSSSKDQIKKDNMAIVVEGFFDHMILNQQGEKRTVSTMGTALTETQLKKIFSLCDVVYFAFDGDAAGQKAAINAAELSLSLITDTKRVKFVFFENDDPDSFIRKFGLDGWDKKLTESLTLSQFLSKDLVNRNNTILLPEEKIDILNKANEITLKIKNAPLFKALFISHIKEIINLNC